jgi:multidrug transporter EmrE-like cation transporter
MQNLNNIIFIYYIEKVESTLFLPLISVLGIVGSVFIGCIAFKEKLTLYTATAILISVISIYLLNL